MVTCLVSLTRLARLSISFFHYTSPSGRLDLDPATWTRTILPALTYIDLDCSIRYMENIVARIDCPRLNSLNLYPSDSYNYIKLQVSQIYELINRSEDPLLTCFDWVDVDFSSDHIGLRASHKNPHNAIFLSLSGENWKLSHLLQVFSQFSLCSPMCAILLSIIREFHIKPPPTWTGCNFSSHSVLCGRWIYTEVISYWNVSMGKRLLDCCQILTCFTLRVGWCRLLANSVQLAGFQVTQ